MQLTLRNREVMADIIVRRFSLQVQDMFHTTHNYIDHDSSIVRKGPSLPLTAQVAS